jgi:uncharacterized membrane protein (DUF4010 family)
MAVSQNTREGDGTMTAVMVAAIIIGALLAALLCAMEATRTIFSTGGIPLLQYGQTLWAWHSRVLYGTQTVLPHPLAWHVISVVVIGVVLLVVFILTSSISQAVHRHSTPKQRGIRYDNGLPESQPQRWRDDPKYWQ